MSALTYGFRRSETTYQLQYEQDIYDQQHSEHSAGDLGPKFDKMVVSDEHEPEHQGFRAKIKGMVKDAFPEAIQDLKIMGGMTALETRVKREMHDPHLFPEVEKVAHVRRGLELCVEEQAFIATRKVRARDKFARYIGVKPEDVDARDVPTVSFGGSGGGFRAMIGCLGYCRQMQHAGLWDCLTYVSGVSGSCWSLAAYYTFGHASFDKVIAHYNGAEPLPIFTAIRHERPWKDWKDKEHPFEEPDHGEGDHKEADDAWFQWYEMTPYEVGCDETQAWVPTWGFGRPFDEGKSTMQLPEQSLALLLGLCTSAPAGPLTSYIGTISRNLPTGFLGNSIHSLASRVAKFWGKQGTEEFQEHHPLHACNEHNFMYHYTHPEPGQARPPGLENSPRIHLIDSGMDNNCPTYVLLHPSRQADVIINMDASSDVQKDTFQERVDQIGGRRVIKFTRRHDIKPGPDLEDPDRFKDLYAQVYDGVPCERPETVVDSYGRTVKTPPAPAYTRECTMVYMPLLPNEKAVPDYDPSTAKFSGSYNLVWTPEQVEMLVKVCIGNFEAGEGTLKEVMRAAWQRKKAERERVGLGADAAEA
ncbi:hypothetical protein B0A55_02837 [Friedmanniomyces simplex]|uniref:Lysophospholipase n=1 Tax=Friedmanniomyces simplex TaxID=329884 RepID=A0A4U0XPL9_9PEZI|nr:hypothetical protein B0A55_02837 [Friedmanniomyces simplex]